MRQNMIDKGTVAVRIRKSFNEDLCQCLSSYMYSLKCTCTFKPKFVLLINFNRIKVKINLFKRKNFVIYFLLFQIWYYTSLPLTQSVAKDLHELFLFASILRSQQLPSDPSGLSIILMILVNHRLKTCLVHRHLEDIRAHESS